MFFCRTCNTDFDVLKCKPMILPCGHTFCNCCIVESFSARNSFDCINCPFTVLDFSTIIQNLILTDLNSRRQSPSFPTSNQPFFSQGHLKEQQMSYGQRQFQQMEAALKVNQIQVQNFPENTLETGFRSLGFQANQLESNYNLKKCLNSTCQRMTQGKYCSVRCQDQSSGITRSFLGMKIEPSPLLSLQRSTTPKKLFSLESPRDSNSYSNLKNTWTVQKSRGNRSPFGKINNLRCSRNGCLNDRFKGFGDEFLYCGTNCFTVAEGREFNAQHN